jgi:YD repeat-containing protein
MTEVSQITSTPTVLETLNYSYDAAGNRTTMAESDGSLVTWTYDSQNQLVGENRTGTNPYRQTYTYDPASNRTLENVDGARTTYAYDVANQLEYSQAAAGTTTYTFDANGNQLVTCDPTNALTTTTWNFENQPTQYQLPTGARVTCLYNADNRQVSKDE